MKNELGFFNDNFLDDFFRTSHNQHYFDLKTDIKETENGYNLEIEMPGYTKDEVKISLENGYLTIQAEKENKKEEKEKYIVRERYYGKATRSYYVGNINQEEITANFTNGILNVFVPKEKKEKKYITVQ